MGVRSIIVVMEVANDLEESKLFPTLKCTYVTLVI